MAKPLTPEQKFERDIATLKESIHVNNDELASGRLSYQQIQGLLKNTKMLRELLDEQIQTYQHHLASKDPE